MSEFVDNRVLDWDSPIEDDGNGFVLLPEADYDFIVSGFDRGQYNGSANIPACPKAMLTLTISAPEGNVQVKQDLYLCGKMEWKISSFFRSIGQKKHGERLVMDWNAVIGSTGMAHFIQRTYTGNDGTLKKANDVQYFIDYIAPEKMAPKLDDSGEDIPF